MSLSERVAGSLPYLRRYARALTGDQESGDHLVRATLSSALTDNDIKAMLENGRTGLYRAFTQIWNHSHHLSQNDEKQGRTDEHDHEGAAQERLGAIAPTSRQALLLTTLEGFSPEDTASILGLDSDTVRQLVQEAVAEIDKETATNVLIIEDEPLISMQLENLVTKLGHEICGTAATRTQSQEVVAKQTPGLVLADIQLADGSSGLDAVDDILTNSSVPVIFITAYPERLLTGDRPEPTYLITKPFEEKTVRAAISQALFFASSKPIT